MTKFFKQKKLTFATTDGCIEENGFYNLNNIDKQIKNGNIPGYNNPLQEKSKIKKFFFSNYSKVFWLCFIITAIFFLPSVIQGSGVHTYYGDYVVQQIPFYKHCHQMVREGNIFWDWGTDLGANFIGSYSFYLFGSPFFWLTIPFPNEWLPYMMVPLFCLKFAVAGVTSYAYIQRFVKNKNYAIVGALLYAFSGFQIMNIFFNHFHDVVAFFPLMLIGIEEVVVNNKKGPFLIAVALSATISYFFFVGQVAFMVIYFFVRVSMCHSWKMTVKKFLILALEAIVGVMISAVILLPSILAIIDNPRLDSSLYGYNILFYNKVQRYGAIIQSFLFPAEIAARPNFFADHDAKWASMAGWFPLISLSGVMAYITSKKRTWLKTLMVVLIVAAFVPGFNSAFFAFNGAYYARWFYMPILMFAVATVISLEDRKINIMKGHKITFFMTLVIFIVVGFFPQKADGNVVYGLYKDGPKFFLYSAIAFASIIGFYIIMKYFRNHKNFFKIIISSLSAFCIIAGLVYIQLGKQVSSNHEWIVENLVEKQLTRDILGEDEDSFFRVDFPSSFDNLGMYWDYPSLTAFHSVVPQSITDFYTDIGVKRGVASRPETSYFGVRGMTSVKYYFQRGSGDAAPPMPGFEYVKDSNGVRIYKNQYFVPIGFTYDQYVSEKSYSTITKENKDKAMMRAIVLNDAQIVKYGKLLNQANLIGLDDETEETYFENCKKRAASSCKTFSKDNTGFNATIDLEKENLVFFSVPYEKGWSVEVNGQKADIEKVNIGFMAVKVPAGKDNVIRFNYETPGLKLGLLITICGILIFAVYMLIYFKGKKKKQLMLVNNIKNEVECFDSSSHQTLSDNICQNIKSPENDIYPPLCESCKKCFRLNKNYNEPIMIETEDKPFPFSKLLKKGKNESSNVDTAFIDNNNTPTAQEAVDNEDFLENYYNEIISKSNEDDEK